MINKEMSDALNKQVDAEMYASNLYLGMYGWLAERGLPGFAEWMRLQAAEEYEHCMRIFNYIIERGGSVQLGAIPKPEGNWKSVLDVASELVDHEAKVTGMINNLMALAIEHKDYAASTFLQWFVNEQVEEESNVGDVLARVKMIGDNTAALYHLDASLGQRTASPAPEAQE